MEVFWFMKKVFFKKATCFLLILLMTMTSILSVCFASTYENSFDEPAVIAFDTADDKKYVLSLYNKLRKVFGGREILFEEDFLSTDLIALYRCVNKSNCGIDFSRVGYALDFLEVLAYNNGIRFARS